MERILHHSQIVEVLVELGEEDLEEVVGVEGAMERLFVNCVRSPDMLLANVGIDSNRALLHNLNNTGLNILNMVILLIPRHIWCRSDHSLSDPLNLLWHPQSRAMMEVVRLHGILILERPITYQMI